MKTTAKIIRLLATINTEEEWKEINHAFGVFNWDFKEKQRKEREIIRKAEERKKNEAIKSLWKEGDRVRFYSVKYHEPCLGVIAKRNPKRAKVKVYVGSVKGIWCVPYQHLIKIADKDDITKLAIGKMEG